MSGETITRALGEDWTITAAAKNGAGSALDLTGAIAIEFRVASRAYEVTREATLFALVSLGAGIEFVSAAAGTITITIAAADQAAETCLGNHDYEWFVITADGQRTQQDSGEFVITRSLKAELPGG